MDRLTDFPSIRESVLPPDALKRLAEADVAYAAADLGLSLSFCSMTQACLTREDLIRKAAYLQAEARGFPPGGEVHDWLCAEREVDDWLDIYGLPHHFAANGSDCNSV
jgi:DUF2934 family protein